MNNTAKTSRVPCAVALSLLLNAAIVTAQTPSADPAAASGTTAQSLADIRQAAERFVAAHMGQTAQVEAASLDPRLRLPACDIPLKASATPNSGGARWTIQVACNGIRNWSLYIPVRVISSQKVVVLTRNMMAGQALTADCLHEETRDVSALNQGYFSDPSGAIGKPLRRALAAGSVLPPEAIAAATIVHHGQIVPLISRSNGFEVRSQGKAMADGGSGDRLMVENANSHRIVQGVVQEDGSVEVQS